MRLTDEEEALIKKLRAEKITWKPKMVSEYTQAEINIIFANLHALALEHYNQTKQDGEADENFDHWCSEALMELLGKDVWDSFNAFQR